MFLKKIFQLRVFKRVLVERLAEPIHLNVFAIFVAIFGTFRAKVFCDLVFRQHNAYGILESAMLAKNMGHKGLSVIEFGVANAAGLCNMSKIANKVSKLTGIAINVIGFDTGEGLTVPDGYKDYSDRFQAGDYPHNKKRIQSMLSDNAKVIYGDVENTVQKFIETLDSNFPVGYIVLDLDLYSSTRSAFKLLEGDASKYLPTIMMYVDDIDEFRHSKFCGEELAIEEFNKTHKLRKIERDNFIKTRRLFKSGKWLNKIYKIQVFDHECFGVSKKRNKKVLSNPYF